MPSVGHQAGLRGAAAGRGRRGRPRRSRLGRQGRGHLGDPGGVRGQAAGVSTSRTTPARAPPGGGLDLARWPGPSRRRSGRSRPTTRASPATGPPKKPATSTKRNTASRLRLGCALRAREKRPVARSRPRSRGRGWSREGSAGSSCPDARPRGGSGRPPGGGICGPAAPRRTPGGVRRAPYPAPCSAPGEPVVVDDRLGGLRVALAAPAAAIRAPRSASSVAACRTARNIVLEAAGGNQLQQPGRLVLGVPERVPLAARLEAPGRRPPSTYSSSPSRTETRPSSTKLNSSSLLCTCMGAAIDLGARRCATSEKPAVAVRRSR